MAPPTKSPPIKFGSTSQAPRVRKWIGQNAIAEVRSETCDLPFDGLSIVFRASVRYVAVGPGSMPANWSATRVEERWLTEKHEGSIRGESSLRLGNFLQACSSMWTVRTACDVPQG